MGHAPAHGKATAEACRQVGCSKSQKLLVRIEAPAVLGGKGAADGSRLYGGEQEACKRQRQQRIDVGPVDVGNSDGWQPLRHLAQKLDALGIQAEQHRGHNAADDDEKRDRFMLQKDLAENEYGKCSKPDRERSEIGLAEMSEEMARVLPEIAMRAVKPEQFR